MWRCSEKKVKVKLLTSVQLFATPWSAAYQAPPFMGFSRQEYWSGVPLPSPFEKIAYTFICLNLFVYSLHVGLFHMSGYFGRIVVVGGHRNCLI